MLTAAEIRQRLAALADPERAEKVRRTVPGVRTLGAAVPDLRALARQINGTPEERIALLDALAATGSRDEFLVGVFALAALPKKALATIPWKNIDAWARTVDNWETCDQLASGVAAPRLHAEPALLRQLEPFARHRHSWQRRFALATAAALNQKGRSYPETTLALCATLAADKDPMIQTALAWALRELTKSNRAAVVEFLNTRDLPARTKREASRKL